jgi:predicted dehydrogenase
MTRDPVRICLVGTGRAGRVHANSIARRLPQAALAAAVDSDATALGAMEPDFGVSRRFGSLEAALEDGNFDAVVITTPTFTHRDLAVAAAKAGKHVFVEKPMAISLAECDAMIDAASTAGVILQIGFMRRFDPEFVGAYERVAGGEIGKPMVIKSLTHGPGLPPPWARDRKLSNGMIAEVNSHDWDCIRWLTGANPESVSVSVANFKGKARGVEDPDFYDTLHASVRFESGALGSVTGICPCDYGYDARVEVVGEKGIIQIGTLQGQDVIAVTDRETGIRAPVYRTWPERFAWGYIREMEHFVDCIRKDEKPRVGGDDGRWAVACVLAGNRSIDEGRAVRLDEVLG